MPDHSGKSQIGQQARLHERRLAGSAGAEHQNEGASLGCAPRQQFAQLVARPRASEEHLRMLELEGFQATERRLMPADGDRLAFGSRRPFPDAAFEQSVQMFVQLILEFIRGAE